MAREKEEVLQNIFLGDGMTQQTIAEYGLPFVRIFFSLRCPVCNLAWSHNGRYLAAAQNDSNEGIRIFDVESPYARSKYKSDGSHFVSFEPTGRFICMRIGNSICIKDFTSRDQPREVYTPKGEFRLLSFSPDGEYILISSQNEV